VTDLLDCHAITDNHESPDMTLTADKNDPIENTDPADPTLPMESTEPIDPTDNTELREPMDSTESRDHSDHRERSPRSFVEAFPTCKIVGPMCPRSPGWGATLRHNGGRALTPQP
jgi:hypothetical protein